MNRGISKSRSRRSRVNLSKALQETPLAAITKSSAGVNGGIPQDALRQPTKRSLDVTSDIDPLPAKRARLTQTDTQQSGLEEEISEQPDKPTLQQPKPRPSKCSHASSLQDFVEPVHSDPRSTALHSFVSEWLESVGLDREKRCRSDSHLHFSSCDLISRQLTQSEPEMGYLKDADRFTLPPPPSTQVRTEDFASSTNASVRHPSYRERNLQPNGICIRYGRTRLPDYISSHVEGLRAERDSPSPSAEQIDGYLDELSELAEGCTEADVERVFQNAVFPEPLDPAYGRPAGLDRAQSSLMSSHLIPNNLESRSRVSRPKPDLLYGYSSKPQHGAFTQRQFLAQDDLHPQNARFADATTQGLRFPFFAIEFKADGDLWIAANQCAGASSACVNAVDRLNTLLQESGSKQRVDNFSYSIAMDNNMAQLYVSWKEADLNYYMQQVDVFVMARPEEFKNFRKQVRNILDWGKDKRLTQIRDALDIILEENQKQAAEDASLSGSDLVFAKVAQARPTPSQLRRRGPPTHRPLACIWGPSRCAVVCCGLLIVWLGWSWGVGE
ncbi:hypothetical protein B0T21DRAFT_344204 [Apiosordaria backusii]|uniref:DUF7924 domain-containing protein n=1 Tax=Apiosordaria backusii TaxID=314023 RepID=A0AA40K788_9PEZI|nr:hypothetical protein B0T21DRAFT_344204 [Apiosordaria backusii]